MGLERKLGLLFSTGLLSLLGCGGSGAGNNTGNDLSPENPGCVADYECKGERVCIDGKCVSPQPNGKPDTVSAPDTKTILPDTIAPQPDTYLDASKYGDTFTFQDIFTGDSSSFPDASCTPKAYSGCHQGDLWWFDSCNQPHKLKQSCDYGCEENWDEGFCKDAPEDVINGDVLIMGDILFQETGSGCSSEDYTCLNGDCIPQDWVCDDVKDCSKGEDEKDCAPACVDECSFYSQKGCGLNAIFTCEYDEETDCLKWMFSELCGPSEYCKDGVCQPENAGCGTDEFQCLDDYNCIPISWLCDGVNDCSKGEDEKDCTTVCQNGETLEQGCGSDVGECQKGMQYKTCSNGQWGDWGSCQGEVKSKNETCNNKDDNCNGNTDENLTQTCYSDCGSGLETCVTGSWKYCTAPVPGIEICNGQDDDCNGKTDEDGVCSICDDLSSSYSLSLENQKCCAEGEYGGLVCIADSFNSAIGKTSGLAWDSGFLWVIGMDGAYKIDSQNNLISGFVNTTGGAFGDAAVTNDILWITDIWKNSIYGFDKDTEQLVMSLKAPSPCDASPYTTTGLAPFPNWPSKLILSCYNLFNINDPDTTEGDIFSIETTTGEVNLHYYHCPGPCPSGLASGPGNVLWIADSCTKKIYKAHPGDPFLPAQNSFPLPTQGTMVGLASGGGYLYVSLEKIISDDMVYQLEIIED